jgi:hypothetical protein
MVAGTSELKPDIPSDGAILERAKSYGNIAIFTVKLQHRRLQSEEPEDEVFPLRYTMDFEFLVVALYRLLRSAQLASQVPLVKKDMETAINKFKMSLPFLTKIRNVAEHFDEYALDDHPNVDKRKRRHKKVSRRQLQVSKFDGKTYSWLGESVDIDATLKAAESLFLAIKESLTMFASKQKLKR